MVTKNELKKWANDLKPIIFDINVALNNLVFLEHENSNYLRVNYFETHTILLYQQHFILVIQLAKLFSENKDAHKRNIFILFNKFKNERIDGTLLCQNKVYHVFKSKNDILTEIKNLKNEIDSYRDEIDRIKELRDKVFAHTDPKNSSATINVDKIKCLVSLCNNIYNTLVGQFLEDLFNPIIANRYDFRSLVDFIKDKPH